MLGLHFFLGGTPRPLSIFHDRNIYSKDSMRQSFISTALYLGRWTGILFSIRSPGNSPTVWGQADGNNPALRPTLRNRRPHQSKGSNDKPPTPPWNCGDNQKVIALHLSSAIPWLSPWMHMTGALLSCWD